MTTSDVQLVPRPVNSLSYLGRCHISDAVISRRLSSWVAFRPRRIPTA